MDHRKSWFQIIFWKLIIAAVVGGGLFFGAGAAGFPMIYRFAFTGYAVLGFIVYVVLDMPPMKPLSGWAAGVGILVFYIVVSGGYIIAGNVLPQFEPEFEIEGIARKTEKFKRDAEHDQKLLAQTRELAGKADKIMARLAEIESGQGVDLSSIQVKGVSIASRDVSNMDPIERGKLVYVDHECGNCHKVGGKGGKKRGPKLDNIGNLANKDQLKDKIFNPDAWHAEGFEERTKDKMPEKYKDVMSDEELEALVSYLLTLKDTSVDTPKPVFK